jgi:hypothetical protein
MQLKSGNSYLRYRQRDEVHVFDIINPRWANYWQAHAYPVMLAIRDSDGETQWMNVTDYLKKKKQSGVWPIKQIVFKGEPFTSLNLRQMRDRLFKNQPD